MTNRGWRKYASTAGTVGGLAFVAVNWAGAIGLLFVVGALVGYGLGFMDGALNEQEWMLRLRRKAKA